MKRLLTCHRQSVLIAIGCTMMLMGCTNEDYDFDKVDFTLGFGSDELVLPGNNSTAEILLDDLLKIEGSDLISTTESGDYMFGKQPDAVNPVTVTIDPITLKESESVDKSIEINLPEELWLLAGQTVDVSAMNIAASGDVAALDYNFELPAAVRSLQRLGVGVNNAGVSLVLNLTLPTVIKRFETVDIDLPDCLTMTCLTQVPGATFNPVDNHLTLRNYEPQGSLQLVFNVTHIEVADHGEANFVKVTADHHIQLVGTVTLGVKVAQLQVPDESSILLGGNVDFSGVNITSADGVFDPEINLNEAGTVTITSIPDFLLDEEVVADLDNPQIWLNIHSTMPLGGTIKAHLYSDTYPQGIILDGEKAIRIRGGAPDGQTETVTQAVICRYRPDNLTDNSVQVIVDDDLSKLVNKLQEGMTIHFDVTEAKAEQVPATVLLGHEYHLTPAYNFSAPLAFGPQAKIVYRKTFDNWHKDLDKLALKAGSKVRVTGTAVNQIPASLELLATAIDSEGNELRDLNVNLIQKTVAGTKGAATESPVEVEITDATGKGISQLNGLSIKLKATSNAELRGVTLNKQTQTLILKDVNARIVGNVIYDAN